MGISKCIGCGCDDLHACITPSGEGCYWLRLDRAISLGVCSECADHVGRWDAGERTMSGAEESQGRETALISVRPDGYVDGASMSGVCDRRANQGCEKARIRDPDEGIVGRLDPKVFQFYLEISVAIMAGVVVADYPMNYSVESVITTIEPLRSTWWRILLLVVTLCAVSLLLYKSGPALAEWIGAFGLMAALYPLFGLLAGVPREAGLASVLLPLAALVFAGSFAALVAVKTLQAIYGK